MFGFIWQLVYDNGTWTLINNAGDQWTATDADYDCVGDLVLTLVTPTTGQCVVPSTITVVPALQCMSSSSSQSQSRGQSSSQLQSSEMASAQTEQASSSSRSQSSQSSQSQSHSSFSEVLGNCGGCSVFPYTWSVTLSGVTDGGCDNCARFNGTKILTYAGSCQWNWQDSVIDSCGFFAFIQIFLVSGNWHIQTALAGGGGSQVVYDLVGTFDCLGSNTFTFSSTFGTGCTNFPTTLTITPV